MKMTRKNGVMIVEKQSIFSGDINTMEINVSISQVQDWQNGTLIQNAMPNLKPHEREFLLSGMSKKEQEKFYNLKN